MSQSVKLSNGDYIDTSAIYDTTQGKTQQTINTERWFSTRAEGITGTLAQVISYLKSTGGGRVGSAYIKETGYSYLAEGWYNYLWMPHRQGYTDGTGDNQNYGTLILSSMNFASTYELYRISVTSTGIRQVSGFNGHSTTNHYDGLFKISSVTVTKPSSGWAVAITAPTVSGYTFLTWISAASNGDVGTPYIYAPSSASATIYDKYMQTIGGTGYTAWALYLKN